MRVLATDCSLRSTGVAILETNGRGQRALYFGLIQNKSTLASSSCLVAIHDRLAELIHEHEPDCCALEAVIYVQSHKTAIALGAARGRLVAGDDRQLQHRGAVPVVGGGQTAAPRDGLPENNDGMLSVALPSV